MMKKILFAFVSLIAVIAFVGCQSAPEYEVSQQENLHVNEYAETDVSERIIIYRVNLSFDVRDLDDADEFLADLIASDEWFDEETLTASRYSYVIRVKTDRLDDFVASLQDEYSVRSYEKTGTDISLQYQDASNRILALQAQLDRLLELYDEATLSDMIIINQQISEIEVELQQLNGELAQYDSLVEYSVVTLTFYGSTVITQSPFINRLGNAFVNGFNGLVSLLDDLTILLATVFPALVFMAIPAVIVFVVYKKRKAKAQKTQTIKLDNQSK